MDRYEVIQEGPREFAVVVTRPIPNARLRDRTVARTESREDAEHIMHALEMLRDTTEIAREIEAMPTEAPRFPSDNYPVLHARWCDLNRNTGLGPCNCGAAVAQRAVAAGATVEDATEQGYESVRGPRMPAEAPRLASYGRNGGLGPWNGTEESNVGPDPHSTPVARLLAVPCRYCARPDFDGQRCSFWQLEYDGGHNEGRMPRDLALMAAAAPQMYAALTDVARELGYVPGDTALGGVRAAIDAAIDAANGIGTPSWVTR